MDTTTSILIKEEDAKAILNRLDQVKSGYENLEQILNRINDNLNNIIRRQDATQKSLNILDEDRNILEDLMAVSRTTQEYIKQQREHQQSSTKDVKSDISEIKTIADNIPGKIETAVEGKLDTLIKIVEKKKVLFNLPKPSLLKRLKFW